MIAPISPRAQTKYCPWAKAWLRMASLEKNPEKNGTPAIAIAPTRNVG